jgi:CRP-like cAMP-binding protein
MPTKDGRAHSLAPSLRDVFDRVSMADARLRVDAQKPIYATGDEDESLYLIETGQVKLSMPSASGQDCLLAIYTKGEFFGESCFAPTTKRFETATAMQPTVVRRATRRDLLQAVETARATEVLLRHVARRMADRQIAVFDLITMPSEKRLAKVLLAVAEKLGTAEGPFLRLYQKVSHEELSQMVGTTRPRITAFMQKFRTLGLIETAGRAISVHVEKTRKFAGMD